MALKLNLSEQPLNNNDLMEFELSIGYGLPEDYKAFILRNNGGVPDKEYFNEFQITCFSPIKYGKYILEEACEMLKDIYPSGYMPIANDVCGESICLDLKIGDTYGYVYWVPSDGDDAVLLAENFTELLDGMTEEGVF